MTAQLLRGVDHARYHRDDLPGSPRLSRSIACTLLMETPQRAWRRHPGLGGAGQALETKAADMGSIVHALISGDGPAIEVCMIPSKDSKGKLREPSPAYELEDALRASLGMAKSGMIPAPNWLTDDAKKFAKDSRERGGIPVLAHDLLRAKEAAAALPEKLAALGIDLGAYESELTILWESGGVALKTRPDLTSVSLGHFLDLKVKEEISEAAFEASVVKYGYDMQAAAAVEGLGEVYPELAGRLSFDVVVCEWKPPYDVMVKPMGQAALEYGRGRWERAKALWKRLLPLPEKDWPGWGIRAPWEPKPWNLEAEMVEAMRAAEEPDWAKGT